MNQISKVKKSLITTSTLLLSAFVCTSTALAVDLATDDPPSLAQIVIPIIRIMNVLVISGGAIFVLMLIVTSYKFAMAQGDPKGMQGARQSFTYTVLGGIAVVFTYAILEIMVGSFGLSAGFGSASTIFGSIRAGICGILDIARIAGAGC